MSYNARYWGDKENRAKIAREHTDKMEKEYSDEIKECIKNTVLYDDSNALPIESSLTPKIIVDDIDSVGGAFKYLDGKTAILNFASYKNPGGMFINGSKAQEECLCHESFLYNVLKEKSDYYEFNNAHKNKALYLNRCLYSKDVIFIHDGKKANIDVITCASPNFATFGKYFFTNKKENSDALKSRINFIKNISEIEKVDTLILGAFGCGVFRQDATEVALLFKEAFKTSTVKTIIYAVPSGSDKTNYNAFKKVFE